MENTEEDGLVWIDGFPRYESAVDGFPLREGSEKMKHVIAVHMEPSNSSYVEHIAKLK